MIQIVQPLYNTEILSPTYKITREILSSLASIELKNVLSWIKSYFNIGHGFEKYVEYFSVYMCVSLSSHVHFLL
jgi:hypothetical protein